MFCSDIPWHRLALACTALIVLAGCNKPADVPAAEATASAPLADTRLAALYDRACATCHEVDGTGAPRRGDRAAWTPREAGGAAALVASVRQGKGAMPPMGWCPECTEEDLATLVAYLRGVKS
jgi:cytochrome c5